MVRCSVLPSYLLEMLQSPVMIELQWPLDKIIKTHPDDTVGVVTVKTSNESGYTLPTVKIAPSL